MKKFPNFEEQMSRKTYEELYDMLSHKYDYIPETIKAAEQEFSKRSFKETGSYSAYYLEKLKDSKYAANAYHSLIEAEPEIVPILIKAYQSEAKPTVRATLLEIIVEHRLPETAEFLISAYRTEENLAVRSTLLNSIMMQTSIWQHRLQETLDILIRSSQG